MDTMESMETQSTQEKRKRVLLWLDKLSDGVEVQFAVKEEDIEMLYKLMERNEEMDHLSNICMKAVCKEIEEYEAEADRLQELLEDIGMAPESLSQSGKLSVKTLADMAVTLNLNNTNISSYSRGIWDLIMSQSKLKEQLDNENTQSIEIERKTKQTLERCTQLRKLLENFEQQSVVQGSVVEKQKEEITFLEKKAKQYEKNVHSHEAALAGCGYSDNICHENLVKLSEVLKELQEDLKPIQAELNAYHCLPPDIPLAKVRVEVARNELEQLDSKLLDDIDNMKL